MEHQQVQAENQVATVFYTGYTFSNDSRKCIIVYNVQLPVGIVQVPKP